MCAGAFAMGMKIFGDVTSVLSSVAEQAASYVGCVLGSLLGNLGGFGGGGGGGGPGPQQAVQNFVPTGSGCFAAETRVLLANGGFKTIAEIKVGDMVKTGTGRNDMAHVAEVMERTSAKGRNLQFTWQGRGARSDSLRTTDEHLFWVDGQGWVESRALRVGDWLLDDACVGRASHREQANRSAIAGLHLPLARRFSLLRQRHSSARHVRLLDA